MQEDFIWNNFSLSSKIPTNKLWHWMKKRGWSFENNPAKSHVLLNLNIVWSDDLKLPNKSLWLTMIESQISIKNFYEDQNVGTCKTNSRQNSPNWVKVFLENLFYDKTQTPWADKLEAGWTRSVSSMDLGVTPNKKFLFYLFLPDLRMSGPMVTSFCPCFRVPCSVKYLERNV